MTTTEKANLISQDADLAFVKLITTKELNDIFCDKKDYYTPKGVYTTKDSAIATGNALQEMLELGLI